MMDRSEILMGLSILPLAGVVAKIATPDTVSPPPVEEWYPKKQLIDTPSGSCIRSGNLLFVGGIEGWNPDQGGDPGDIKVQIRRVLTSLKGILEGAGSSMFHVLKVQMAVADPNRNLSALNEVYVEFFPGDPPVRSFSGSKTSQMGQEGNLCQVSCIAYID